MAIAYTAYATECVRTCSVKGNYSRTTDGLMRLLFAHLVVQNFSVLPHSDHVPNALSDRTTLRHDIWGREQNIQQQTVGDGERERGSLLVCACLIVNNDVPGISLRENVLGEGRVGGRGRVRVEQG